VNVKELMSFLGLAEYYRKFVHHFGAIARPLTDLFKKNTVFLWHDEHDLAFKTLQSALVTAPILALPDFSKPFCLETDASEYGVRVVLMQDNHPIAFVSKVLDPNMRGLSTYEKEYVTILLAIDQWRSYLQCGEFVIFTYQKSMVHLNEQRLHTAWQQKVFTKLLGLTYKVIYRKGSDNRVADALSRRPDSTNKVSCLALSSYQPKWIDEII
jgi:hypothetical protein